MNVQKMRRYIARNIALTEKQQHTRWLASLTPEHRRTHTGPFADVGACMECLTANWPKIHAQMMAAFADTPERAAAC